jgi:uncharacterized protein (DUF4415 family)
MAKLKSSPLTDAEEAKIQEGIAGDADNPELTDEQLARMRPAKDVLPPEFFKAIAEHRRSRGRPALERPKQVVSIRLDPDVVEKFKASGKGWQSRINEILKRAKVG